MMKETTGIDPTLRALGGQGRYQLLQLLVINLGALGAAYQLLGNIFIGREVAGQRCAAPTNGSVLGDTLRDVDWNSSDVTYGQCEIIVSRGNLSGDAERFPCLFGFDYGYPRELSFRTQFDLVCDRKLLGGLVQTLVIMGQGFGAVLSSIASDRWGRKKAVVASQLGLLLMGMATGLAPNFAVLALAKFLVGGFQQGVIAGSVTMSVELLPTEMRRLALPFSCTLWCVGSCSLTLWAYALRHFTWRYLQYGLSLVSALLALLQMWYLDDSLRWLVSNGQKEAAIAVLQRAACVNRKNVADVIKTLHDNDPRNCEMIVAEGPLEKKADAMAKGDDDSHHSPALNGGQEESLTEMLGRKQADKLTLLTIFRRRTLFVIACIMWIAWIVTTMAYFTIFLMSTSLHGNRFLNYFLTAAMELPPGFFLYFVMNRVGRNLSLRGVFATAGVGLVSCAIFRIYTDSATMGTLSVVASLVGAFGAGGSFNAVFCFTPELFPTNLRNQALGVSSFAGRIGGMIAPLMVDFAAVAIWAPGVFVGGLCFLVVALLHFIPETRGRQLPDTVTEIKAWKREPLLKTSNGGKAGV